MLKICCFKSLSFSLNWILRNFWTAFAYIDAKACGYSILFVGSLLSSVVSGHTPRDNPVYRATPRYGRIGLEISDLHPLQPLTLPSGCPLRRRRARGALLFLAFHISTFHHSRVANSRVQVSSNDIRTLKRAQRDAITEKIINEILKHF